MKAKNYRINIYKGNKLKLSSVDSEEKIRTMLENFASKNNLSNSIAGMAPDATVVDFYKDDNLIYTAYITCAN